MTETTKTENEFLLQHGVDVKDWLERGWEYRYFICPSPNERTEHYKSLLAQYGKGNVAEVPLRRGQQRSLSMSEPVSGWAFFVREEGK